MSFRIVTPNVIFNLESFSVLGCLLLLKILLATILINQLFKKDALKTGQQEPQHLPILAS